MTRERSSLPTYLLHKPTGQARCRIAGKDHYLGPYGSEGSRIKYGQLVAKLAGGVPIDPLASSKRGRTADRWFIKHFGSNEVCELSCQDGTLGMKLAVKGDDVRAFGTSGNMQNISSGDDDDESDSLDEDDSPKRRTRGKPSAIRKF